MAGKFEFERIAQAALNCSEQLVETWLPHGDKIGHEWRATNPTRADSSAGSFSVNLNNGRWGDFATPDKGGDLVSLYAYLFCGGTHADAQKDAARALADQLGMPDAVPALREGQAYTAPSAPAPAAPLKPKKKRKEIPWRVIAPVPDDAPPVPRADKFRGVPDVSWAYRDTEGRLLGYVWRFTKSNGEKEVMPYTYCQREDTGAFEWRSRAFEEPRPLYGLERLAEPFKCAIVVEGEKCRDALQAMLPEHAVLSWPGGGNVVDKADWTPLAGHEVFTWADADAQREKLTPDEKSAGVDPASKPLLPPDKQPGFKAMAKVRAIARELGCRTFNVRLPEPGAVPSGWDCADWIADGATADELYTWLCDRGYAEQGEDDDGALGGSAEPGRKGPEPAPASGGGEPPNQARAGGGGGQPDDDDWQSDLIYNRGLVSACLANAELYLAHSPEWRGVIAYDEFAETTVFRKQLPNSRGGAQSGPWTDMMDARAAVSLQRARQVEFSPTTVGQAVELVADQNRFHPVRDALEALAPWDGTRRLPHWLSDYLNVKPSEYVARVGTFFLRGMIARVFEPGCKFDYCLVLEGEQGLGKSTVARTLAWHWFCDTDLDLGNKDSLMALPGHWCYEIAEMGSLMKAEERKQKSFLSRTDDEYRPPYGKRLIKVPRQCVFVGTTNEEEYLKDATGGRRFWPVMCYGPFDIAGLREAMPQLYAEALHDYRQGARAYPTDDEQERLFTPEQIARGMAEPFEDILATWVDDQMAEFSMADAATKGLSLTPDKLTPAMTTRIGITLKALGCVRVEQRTATDKSRRRLYLSPPAQRARGLMNSSPKAVSMPDEKRGHRAPF